MNKQELIRKIAADAELTQKQAAAALESAVAAIKETVAAGDKVQLIGFGTFDSKKREARKGRNPRTGKTVKIAAATTPVFKAGKAFKDEVKK
jgi:DNA-binding protein HU-beta